MYSIAHRRTTLDLDLLLLLLLLLLCAHRQQVGDADDRRGTERASSLLRGCSWMRVCV